FLGVSILIFAFTHTFAVLLASFTLWSVAATLMSGADFALLFDTLKASGDEGSYERIAGRGHAFGWAGAGIATFLGGPVAALTDIRFTIIFGAGTCLLTAFTAFSMWEPGREESEEDELAPEHYLRSIGSAFSEVWRNAEVRALVLLTGTSFAALEALDYLIQPYLIDRGLEIGVLFSMLQVPLFAVGIIAGLVASRLKGRGRTMLLVVPAVGAGAYLALVVSPGLSAYAAFPLTVGLAALVLPIATGEINRRIDSKHRATVLSIHGMVGSIVLAGLAPSLGFATDRWGISAAFAVGGIATLASLLLFGPMLLAQRPSGDSSASIPAPADV
ncbi:MAG: MFS transporter, partial [Dehalococcoidia bacterium]